MSISAEPSGVGGLDPSMRRTTDSGFLNRVRMFDSCRGHERNACKAYTDARFRSRAQPPRAGPRAGPQHGKLVDLSGFQRAVLPLIQGVPLSRLQRATSLSLRYVSMIRRGERTPHPRHWQALIDAAE